MPNVALQCWPEEVSIESLGQLGGGEIPTLKGAAVSENFCRGWFAFGGKITPEFSKRPHDRRLAKEMGGPFDARAFGGMGVGAGADLKDQNSTER